MPALAAWSLAWLLFVVLGRMGVSELPAMAAAVTLGAALAPWARTPWRRVFIAFGFPLSLAASGLAGTIPAWTWLLLLALLALAYPVTAWRDAPVFPTPAGALTGLATALPLPSQARILDAGCGLGHGLRELRREYPQAYLHGLEYSRPLRLWCAWRCRFATVERADMWAADWSGFDLVYLFQRPESMTRAAVKAAREMRPGSALASLEFPIDGRRPSCVLDGPGAKRLWIYRNLTVEPLR